MRFLLKYLPGFIKEFFTDSLKEHLLKFLSESSPYFTPVDYNNRNNRELSFTVSFGIFTGFFSTLVSPDVISYISLGVFFFLLSFPGLIQDTRFLSAPRNFVVVVSKIFCYDRPKLSYRFPRD